MPRSMIAAVAMAMAAWLAWLPAPLQGGCLAHRLLLLSRAWGGGASQQLRSRQSCGRLVATPQQPCRRAARPHIYSLPPLHRGCPTPLQPPLLPQRQVAAAAAAAAT